MSAQATYLKISVLLNGITLLAITVIVAAVSNLVGTTTASDTYIILSALGLLLLFLSLLVGCYGFLTSLKLLDCAHWNIRMVASSTTVQLVLLCLGTLFILLTPFAV